MTRKTISTEVCSLVLACSQNVQSSTRVETGWEQITIVLDIFTTAIFIYRSIFTMTLKIETQYQTPSILNVETDAKVNHDDVTSHAVSCYLLSVCTLADNTNILRRRENSDGHNQH